VLRTLVQRAVERRRLEDENRRHVRHLESQLAEARVFQHTLLPPRSARLAGFEIHADYRPTAELAGDLYDYAADGEGGIALLVADVVGHGASAAMLTAIVKSAFRSSSPERYDPQAVVRRVAAAIASLESDRFVTLIAGRIGPSGDVLEYVSAGHEGGLVAGPGRDPVDLPSTGPIVSPVLAFLGWDTRRVALGPDAVVLLYTDGVSDASDGAEPFGVERIRRLARHCESGPAGLVSGVLREVDAFVRGRPPNDDRTVLAAGRT
jgi:sigma-B regulation protein RsbU (phosphoserine phosphatase)